MSSSPISPAPASDAPSEGTDRRVDHRPMRRHPHRGDLDRKLELANRQATKISRLVDQLFDVSRFMAGATMQLERERVDLVELAEDLLDGLRDALRRAGSEIDFRARPLTAEDPCKPFG